MKTMKDERGPGDTSGSLPWRSAIVLLAFLAIAGFFVLTEHRAHLFGALPFVLLLACPLLHVFMHRGHGEHGHSHSANPSRHPSDTPHQH